MLYEDNHLIAVAKPAGLLIQGDHSADPCLLELVRGHLIRKYSKPGDAYLGLLHRLDRPVAGVVLLAKTSKAASRLSQQWRVGQVHKRYTALVASAPPSAHGTLVHFISVQGEGRPVQCSLDPTPGGKRSELSYSVRGKNEWGWVLDIELKTGRKHQIRAQCAFMGFPLVGDVLYGGPARERGGVRLLGAALAFNHPVSGARVQIQWPQDNQPEWACI